ncbi:unnamed protein product [Wuchereria bancrofti]|uniref:Cystatin domain-containing protein n=2 Tax=Wuchereria bancrofti TaxID=6293 RepID=A0A3P7GIG1_WUCBA|nr:unnamed protein product [Wuchereria bancrofti]
MLQFILLLAIFISSSNAQYENDPDVKDVVDESMMKINKQLKGQSLFKLERILKANVLVVQSTIYKVTLILTPTTCLKSQKVKDLSKCQADRRQKKKKIYAEISESMSGKITVKVR